MHWVAQKGIGFCLSVSHRNYHFLTKTFVQMRTNSTKNIRYFPTKPQSGWNFSFSNDKVFEPKMIPGCVEDSSVCVFVCDVFVKWGKWGMGGLLFVYFFKHSGSHHNYSMISFSRLCVSRGMTQQAFSECMILLIFQILTVDGW